jgi:hypothetical protein
MTTTMSAIMSDALRAYLAATQAVKSMDPMVVVNIVLDVLTLGVLVIMIMQRNEMIKQREDLRENAERQLRAYISIDTASISIGTGPFGGIHGTYAGEVVADIRFKNFGQTPAYNVRLVTLVGTAAYPWDNSHRCPPPNDQAGTVGPTVVFTALPKDPTRLDLSKIARLSSGDDAVWVFGRIEYVDAFKKPRWVNFRSFYRGNFYDNTFPLTPDAGGNDAN